MGTRTAVDPLVVNSQTRALAAHEIARRVGGASPKRRTGRLVVALTLTVFILGAGSIGWLAARSVALQDLRSVANHVQIDAYRESVMEWEAFAAGSVSPGLEKARIAIDTNIRAQIAQLVLPRTAPDMTTLFEAYDRNIEAEFAALDAGRVAEAKLIKGRVVASSDTLATATDAVSRYYDIVADRALIRAAVGSVLILLLGATLIVLITRQARRARDRAGERFKYQAMHDALTGLPNRTLLTDQFKQSLRLDAQTGSKTGLLLMDLDRFKDVNETLGHPCGDELLIQIGERVRGVLRDVDTVARLGGDQFEVLLPGVDGIDSALTVARGIQSSLARGFEIEGLDLDIESTIGVVVSGRDGDDVTTLLRHADMAMYAAKRRGRSVATYEETDESSPERLTLLRELRQAIDAGDLELHYQPKISLIDRRVVGVEALVRWKHPDRGMVPPGEFIPLAEHSGLIGPLTRHVLSLALAQAQVWNEAGIPLPVAVNMSARNLGDDRLVDDVTELLRAHALPPGLLILEITESAIVTDPYRARELLSRFYELGVKLSLDDFGTGYTSLAQLRTIPIGELKIDRSFVATMTTDAGNAHIVRGIIALAHNLGFSTVAEGVEDAETLAALSELACDEAQGYLLARPMPAEDFDRWYSNFSSELHNQAAAANVGLAKVTSLIGRRSSTRPVLGSTTPAPGAMGP